MRRDINPPERRRVGGIEILATALLLLLVLAALLP
jgi:hypothetical protein